MSVEDYGRNLRNFIKIALSVGAKTALLTRPHTTPEGGFKTGSWRATVPTYNAELVRTAATAGVPGIDVWRLFDGRLDQFVDQAHLNREGHSALGEFLAQELLDLGFLDE